MVVKNKVDILDRKRFVKNVISILDISMSSKKYLSFAINGKWGSGKTFTIDLVLDSLKNKEKNVEKENNDKYIIYYNCWEYTFFNEPLISIIETILDNMRENSYVSQNGQTLIRILKNSPNILFNLADNFIKNSTGSQIADVCGTSESIRELGSLKKTIDDFKIEVGNYCKKNKLIIIVDEIDRCLPNVAINILERLYLLFNNQDNCVLMYVLDKEKLEYSVRQTFGEKVESDDYLKKFINFTLDIHCVSPTEVFFDKYEELKENFDLTNKEDFLDNIKKLFLDVDIRTMEKIIDLTNLINKMIYVPKTRRKKLPLELLFYEFICVTIQMILKRNKISLNNMSIKDSIECILTDCSENIELGQKQILDQINSSSFDNDFIDKVKDYVELSSEEEKVKEKLETKISKRFSVYSRIIKL